MRNFGLMSGAIVVCLCAALRAEAQAVGGAPLDAVPLFPTRQPAFDIPFQIDEPIPGQEPVEVQLHASSDRGANWTIAAKVAPEAGKFSFRAPQDGEYWFLVRTLNRQGRLLPEKAFSPEMRVLVDSLPPRLEAQCTRGNAGEVYCTWQSSDPHLQADSLELKYQGIDGGPQWQSVAVAPSTQGADGVWSGRTTFVPGAVRWPLFVRVEVSDVAGNRAATQVQVEAPPGAGPQSLPLAPSTTPLGAMPAAPVGAPTPSVAVQPSVGTPATTGGDGWQASTPAPPPAAAPPQVIGRTPSPTPAGPANSPPLMSSSFPGRVTAPPRSEAIPRVPSAQTYAAGPRAESLPVPPAGETIPAPQIADADSPYRRASEPRTSTNFTPNTVESLPVPATSQIKRSAPSDAPTEAAALPTFGPNFGSPDGALSPEPAFEPSYASAKPEVGAPPPVPTPAPARDFDGEATPPGVNPRMVNSRRFELEYDVESLGSSSVAKVELWSTRDAGRSWSIVGDDADRTSPHIVEVDEEGIYGFRIVIETAGGLRSPAPHPGDLPEVWVGVDVTKPAARIVSVQQRSDDAGPTLDIRWEADDRLLPARPITLSFAEDAQGPWTTIVAGLPNTREYDWRFDVRTPERIFVKLEVRDVAGNTTTYVTPEPALIERIRPHGRIRGVRPIGESAGLRVPSQILPR